MCILQILSNIAKNDNVDNGSQWFTDLLSHISEYNMFHDQDIDVFHVGLSFFWTFLL